MRLAETLGIPDWKTLGETIPDEIFEGWCDHHEREPFGSNQMYDFLASSFVIICQAFHSSQFAFGLKKADFKTWDVKLPAVAASSLSDDDVLITMQHWEALKQSGSV